MVEMRVGRVVEYVYGERSAAPRSTSPREVLPIVYDLASVPAPKASSSLEYTGYPLSVDGFPVLLWYFGLLPTLIVIAWWWSRRPGQSQVAVTMRLRSAFMPRLRPRFIVANAPAKDPTSRLRFSRQVSGRLASSSRPPYAVRIFMGCTIERIPQMLL